MENVIDLKCPGCGGRIIHDPVNNIFKCLSCDGKYTIEDIKVIDKDLDSKEIEKYKCSNCGAEITVDGLDVSTECPYCNNTAIIKSRLSNKYKPDLIIPFQTTEDRIIEEFKKIAAEKKEINMNFVNDMKIDKVKPLYVPYFLYSFGLSARVNIATPTDLKDGVVRIDLDDVPIDGSVKLDDDTMMNLFPYDMNKALVYNHAYLSGHRAEMYDDPIDRVSNRVDEKARETIKSYFTKKMCGVEFIHIYQTSKHIKYILLPVWMIDVKYSGKTYNFYMNGQTGEIVGKTHRINWKLVVLTLTYMVSMRYMIEMLSNINMGSTEKLDNTFFLLSGLLTAIYILLFISFNKKLVKKCDNFNIFNDSAIVREELYK